MQWRDFPKLSKTAAWTRVDLNSKLDDPHPTVSVLRTLVVVPQPQPGHQRLLGEGDGDGVVLALREGHKPHVFIRHGHSCAVYQPETRQSPSESCSVTKHMRMHTCKRMHAYTYTHTYARTHTHTHTNTNTLTQIHTHTHTHTQTGCRCSSRRGQGTIQTNTCTKTVLECSFLGCKYLLKLMLKSQLPGLMTDNKMEKLEKHEDPVGPAQLFHLWLTPPPPPPQKKNTHTPPPPK